MKILFFGKKHDAPCESALKLCQSLFDTEFYLGLRGIKFPEDLGYSDYDYVISYLSPWIIPAHILNTAKTAAINFHPAPPEYPGIGCINFALYNEAKEYGVTCHHMAPQVDTGGIIAVKRFTVYPNDTVETLLNRSYDYQLALFYDIIASIYHGQPLPVSPETWTKKPTTRKELDQLATITPDLSEEEIAKRIRATSFQNWKPCIEVNGHKFELIK